MTVTISGTSGITLPSGSAAVGTTDTQTLTNKTLTSPSVSGTVSSQTITTLTTTTLSDGTNSTSSTNCIQGSAKAWVNFNGTAGSIRASYNVGSITKNGTGDYTVNFTNAMTDSNYSVCGTGRRDTTITEGFTIVPYAYATTSIRVFHKYVGQTFYDADIVNITINR